MAPTPITPQAASTHTRHLAGLAPVIPVLVIENEAHARPLAEALVAGGLPVLEVTLRTDAALDAIRAMAGVPGGIVGAGTILTPDDVANAVKAGARFGVSPGATTALMDAAEDQGLPMLPGAATASEAMALAERGYTMVKFFPAGPAGGPSYLKGLSGPLPAISFCPTGGVSAANAPDYLSLTNVACVGGSWVVPGEALASGDFDRIRDLAAQAAKLAR